jgi:hypothetical protein
MTAVQATDQKQDSARQKTTLDSRYGKIGISAVAAAVHHMGEQRTTAESRFIPADSD